MERNVHPTATAVLPRVCDASVQCSDDSVDQEIHHSSLGEGRIPHIESNDMNRSSNAAYKEQWRIGDTLSSISSIEQQDAASLNENTCKNLQYRYPEGASDASDSSVLISESEEEENAESGNDELAELAGSDDDNETSDFDPNNTSVPTPVLETHDSPKSETERVDQMPVKLVADATLEPELSRNPNILNGSVVVTSHDNCKNACTVLAVGSSYLDLDVSKGRLLRPNMDASNSEHSAVVLPGTKSGDMLANITKLLNVFYPNDYDTASVNPENVAALLEECLQYYNQKVAALSVTVSQLEKEVKDIQASSTWKEQRLIKEHRERLCRLAKDHEDELRAAIERAVNARQQTSSLQEQLDSVQAKLEATEKEAVEETRSTIKSYQEQVEKWGNEKHALLKKVTELENLLKDKTKEVTSLQSINDSLRKQTAIESASGKEYVDHLEKELAKERAHLSTLQSELQQEREHNHYLWAETRKKSQQMASLQSRLEALCSDVSHRDRLLAILKEEILAKITAHTEQEKQTLQSLDLVNDNTLNEKWSELISESLVTKDAKVQQLKKELNEKELLLVKSTAKLKELKENLRTVSTEIKKTEEELNERKRELSTKKLDLYELELNLTRTMNLISDRSAKLEDASVGQGLNQAMLTTPASTKLTLPQSEVGLKKMKDRLVDVERQAKYFLQQCKNRDKQIALLQQDLQSKDEKIVELNQLLDIERGNINFVSGPDVVCIPKTSEGTKIIPKSQTEMDDTLGGLSSKLSGRGSPLGAEGSMGKQRSRKKPTQSHKKTKEISSRTIIRNPRNVSSGEETVISSTSTCTTSKSVASDATTESDFQGMCDKKLTEISIPVCPRHASRLGEDPTASLTSYFSSTSATPIRGKVQRTLFKQDESFSQPSKLVDGTASRQARRWLDPPYHSTPNDVDPLPTRSEGRRHRKRGNSQSSTTVQTD